MNDDFRDPLDAAIAHDLAPLAPTDIDADAALGAMGPALQRARTRRRLTVTSGALGAMVLVLGVGGLLVGSRPSHVNVQSHTTTRPPISTPTTHKIPPTTTPPPSRGSTPTTTATSPTTSTTPVTPTTGDHGGTSQPSSTTKPPVAAAVTKSYTATGGRITVTFASGALTLDSYTPTAGYQADVHKQDPNDVEVRFSNGSHESRIRIRVQGGAVSKEITES